MYRKEVRRRRVVLVALVVTCLVLLSLSFSQAKSGPIHSIQQGLATVAAPIEEGASRALKPARDLVNWFDETFSAQGENDDLEAELAATREQLVEAESAVEDAEELRRQAGLPAEGELASYEPVTARVIGKTPTVWYSTVQIDKGSSAGLEIDDPVRVADGLVGRISDLTGGTATVQLITDHRNAVSAEDTTQGGPSGVLEAEVGDPGVLYLNYIEDESPVKEEAVIATAGWTDGRLSSAYPPGIPVGRVEKVSASQGEFQEVEVEPFADMRELEYVQVLTGGPDRGEVPK